MQRTSLLAVTMMIALAGCSAKPDSNPGAAASSAPSAEAAGPALHDATVQLAPVAGRPAVAYFTLDAPSGAAGKVVAVQVDHFARAELHHSMMHGSMASMDPVKDIAITPGKPLVFAPGGYHVMLFDGDGSLAPGGTTAITLTLDSGEKITGAATVTAAGGDAMGGMKM